MISLAIPEDTGCFGDCDGVNVTEGGIVFDIPAAGVKDTEPDLVISNAGLEDRDELPDLTRLGIKVCAQLSLTSAMVCGLIELEFDVCFGELLPPFVVVECFNKLETLGIFIFGNAGVKLMEGGNCLIMDED